MAELAGGEGEPSNGLMAQFYQGDDSAFEKLVDLWQLLLYGYFRRSLAREEASDLTQDVFLRLFLTREEPGKRFDLGRLFRPWLFRIAHNLLVDRARKSQRERLAPAALLEAEVAVLPPDGATFVPYLDVLSPPERTFVLLWEEGYGDLSQTEIAQVLGVSNTRMHNIKKSALRKLGDRLEQAGEV
jgi:RNA polymerase sigma-70 factor (ECF subfamily)